MGVSQVLNIIAQNHITEYNTARDPCPALRNPLKLLVKYSKIVIKCKMLAHMLGNIVKVVIKCMLAHMLGNIVKVVIKC